MTHTRFERKPLREWTVMVYMGGDNSLSAECVWALTEMKKVASSDQINVIAQFDPSGPRARTKRYEINKHGLRTTDQSTNQGSPYPQHDQPHGLDEDAMDFAVWNPRTEEAHFATESWKANVLADKRQQGREAKKQILDAILAKREEVNAEFPPDFVGDSLDETNAASPITLYNFLSFGVEYYPARHYMVVLSGHSAGIQPSYLLKDETSGGYMTFRQLRAVFRQLGIDLKDKRQIDGAAKTIDILGFDTCLMAMAEICCELHGLVQTVIGSESYTPASGWPYFLILQQLSKCVPASAEKSERKQLLNSAELAQAIVKSYVDYYRDYRPAGISVALSALDVTQVPKLGPIVRKLSTALRNELQKEHPKESRYRYEKRPFTDALVLAHWEAQSYNGEWYVDLVDFCECLRMRYPEEQVSTACEKVINFVKEKFVIKSCVSGPTYQYSNGAAIYFPWSSVATYFWDFRFARDSGWADFLADYTNFTRRSFRVPENPTPEQLKQIDRFERLDVNSLTYPKMSEHKISDHRMRGPGLPEHRITDDKMADDKMADDRMGDDKMADDKMADDRMGDDKMADDKMADDKMADDKMADDRMADDRMADDRMADDRMGSATSGNPIHSMRNPPIVAIEFDCNSGSGEGGANPAKL